MPINTSTGVMESNKSIVYILDRLSSHLSKGGKLHVEFIPDSKNHGKPMMLLSSDNGDCNVYNLEISEAGVFGYEFDDSVS